MVSAKYQEVYKKVGDIDKEIKKDSTRESDGPDTKQKLNLYAWAKVVEKKDITKEEKPGYLDITGKAKRARWQQEVDKGTSPQDAEKKYIELGEEVLRKFHGK